MYTLLESEKSWSLLGNLWFFNTSFTHSKARSILMIKNFFTLSKKKRNYFGQYRSQEFWLGDSIISKNAAPRIWTRVSLMSDSKFYICIKIFLPYFHNINFLWIPFIACAPLLILGDDDRSLLLPTKTRKKGKENKN